MDPLSVSASIATILQVAKKTIEYLINIKSASKERKVLLSEISIVNGLLISLNQRVKGANLNDPWFVSVRSLNMENGPLDQLKTSLEMLSQKLQSTSTRSEATKNLTWPFNKKDCDIILARVERAIRCATVALSNDQL